MLLSGQVNRGQPGQVTPCHGSQNTMATGAITSEVKGHTAVVPILWISALIMATCASTGTRVLS